MSSPEHVPDHFVEDAAAALPPPHDEEPASLRQDILDELRDHLECAFRRELLRTNGERDIAIRNVRERFGDPAKIARRLWFDAMRSRLMLQKVLIGTCAAVIVACVLFGLLLWKALAEMREMNASLVRQSSESNAAILEQSQQANAALLEQLRSLEEASALRDPQWNPVTIRLVTGSKDGAPASGFTVALNRSDDGVGFYGKTGGDGVADCGLQQPGNVVLYVTSPWGERFQRQLQIQPGRAVDLTIVCPAAPPETVPIQWQIDWPSNLDELELRDEVWLLALINGYLNRTFGEDAWELPGGERLLAFHPDGRTVNLSTAEISNDADLIRRSATIRQFLQMREDGNPLVESSRAWSDGVYFVHELGLSQWDGSGSPIKLLWDIHKPAIIFTGSITNGFTGGTIANVLQINRPWPTYNAPATGKGVWTIDVPSGLVAWAKMYAEEAREASARGAVVGSIHESLLYPLFASPITADERHPVQAPRPSTKRQGP